MARRGTLSTLSVVYDDLLENRYMTARKLAGKHHLKLSAAYRAVRLLREGVLKDKPIGVLTTKNGYVLSSIGTKSDDVSYLRRLNGRRYSDAIGAAAALPDVQRRWKSVSDRRILQKMIAPVSQRPRLVESGMRAVLSQTERFGL